MKKSGQQAVGDVQKPLYFGLRPLLPAIRPLRASRSGFANAGVFLQSLVDRGPVDV